MAPWSRAKSQGIASALSACATLALGSRRASNGTSPRGRVWLLCLGGGRAALSQ
jgi:hypothetical protein